MGLQGLGFGVWWVWELGGEPPEGCPSIYYHLNVNATGGVVGPAGTDSVGIGPFDKRTGMKIATPGTSTLAMAGLTGVSP